MLQERRWQIVLFLVCEVMILMLYILGGRWAKAQSEKNIISRRPVEVDTNLLCEVEKTDIVDGEVEFSGWALHLNAQNKSISVILDSVINEKEHIFFGEFFERNDIVNYYVSNSEWGACGFSARISEKELEKDTCYEILVNLSYVDKNDNTMKEIEKKISTGYFYYNGEVYRYDPMEFQKPLITDEELVQVVENGILRMHDSVEEEWVYQFQGKVYYIVNESKNVISEESKLIVPMMPSTSRPDLLPEERKQYGGDHLGAFYANEEYKREGVWPYQVVVVDLPMTYPMTYLSTGIYDDENVCWKKCHVVSFLDWREYGEN